jgi:hypothetical protein
MLTKLQAKNELLKAEVAFKFQTFTDCKLIMFKVGCLPLHHGLGPM